MNIEQSNELEALITEVSNTSHRCGAYDMEDDMDGYEVLFNKAIKAEADLRQFVIRIANKS